MTVRELIDYLKNATKIKNVISMQTKHLMRLTMLIICMMDLE